MRNTNKLLVSAGAVALVLSGAAMAVNEPIAFGGYSIDATTRIITATPCVPVTSCVVTASGADFLQRTVTVGGVDYIQTIVTGNVAGTAPNSGVFADENFVRMGSPTGGIAGRQAISATDAQGVVFTSTAGLDTGWAAVGGNNRVVLQQGLDNSAAAGINSTNRFISTFGFSQDTTAAGAIVGTSLDIGQNVGIAQVAADTDKQLFVLRQRSGESFIPAAGTLELVGGSGGPVTFVRTDMVQATWIGQQVSMGGGLGAQLFGFQAYDVNPQATPPGARTQTFSLSGTGPFDTSAQPWKTTLFGTAPSF
ncbi:MAG: hypothetical protein IDH49_03275 [Gammaproteobacteria bacterium]|nr:hypothetical protein [Gammaproteobacteria bacterium]